MGQLEGKVALVHRGRDGDRARGLHERLLAKGRRWYWRRATDRNLEETAVEARRLGAAARWFRPT